MASDILEWLDGYEWTQTCNGLFEASRKSAEEKRIISRTVNDIRDQIKEMMRNAHGNDCNVTVKPEVLSKNETIALELTKAWIQQCDRHLSIIEMVSVYTKTLQKLNETET